MTMLLTNKLLKKRMKKYLFMLLSLCVFAFAACSESEDGDYSGKVAPQLSPNKDIHVGADGGAVTVTVANAVELNVTQINDKESTSTGSKEVNVKKTSDGSIKDSKNVVEGEWFSAKVEKTNGVYNKLVLSVEKNAGAARSKNIHISCGGNVLGASFMLDQASGQSTSDSGK